MKAKLIGIWVLVCDSSGELMSYGKEANTKFPFDNEEEAVDQARYLLGNQYDRDNPDTIYIMKVFSSGQIRYEEYTRESVV